MCDQPGSGSAGSESHRHLQDLRLADYVMAQLDGLDVTILYPDVHRQLSEDAELRRVYIHLRRIEIAQREGNLD